jgi:hypothetical protein
VLVLLALVLLVGACGDDGGGAANETPATSATSAAPATTTADPVATTGTVAGPTEGEIACIQLAQRYVRQARRIFAHQGTPPDELIDQVDDRLTQFDAIAGTAGCGDEYRNGVCDGLDELTAQGLLVIMPLLPPNGCG